MFLSLAVSSAILSQFLWTNPTSSFRQSCTTLEGCEKGISLGANFAVVKQGLIYSDESSTVALGNSLTSETLLWDLSTGKYTTVPHLQHGAPAFSPTGKLLGYAESDALWLYSINSSAVYKDTLFMGTPSLSMPPLGRCLFTADTTALCMFSKGVHQVGPDSRQLIAVLGASDMTFAISDSHDRIVVTTGAMEAANGSVQSHTISTWQRNGETWRKLTSIFYRKGGHHVAFFPNSEKYAVALYDGTVRVFDSCQITVPSLTIKAVPEDADPIDNYFGMAISDNGRFLATGAHKGGINLWDAASGTPLQQFSGHNPAASNPVQELVFTKEHLVSCSNDGVCVLWRLYESQAPAVTAPPPTAVPTEYKNTEGFVPAEGNAVTIICVLLSVIAGGVVIVLCLRVCGREPKASCVSVSCADGGEEEGGLEEAELTLTGNCLETTSATLNPLSAASCE